MLREKFGSIAVRRSPVSLARFGFMLTRKNRLKLLRYIISASFLAGILLSRELWFATAARSFPRVPLLVALPETVGLFVERLLCVILIGALMSMPVVRRPKNCFLIAIASLTVLIFFDQMRLQPWVYQYLLLLGVLALDGWQTNEDAARDDASLNHVLSLMQLVVAALYVWSGVQKLNFSFSHEILPGFVAPLQNVLSVSRLPLAALGIGVALVETLIGCGLVFHRTRKLCVVLALAMHGLVLGLLIARGYNSIVWAWNVALMFLVVVLFWRGDEPAWQMHANWSKGNRATRLAQVLVMASALLPILSFWGWWDMCLSGALYSGNTVVAVVRINDETYEKLPRMAQQQVFKTKSDGRQILPFFEWSMAELNVPPCPEPRVFRELTQAVCEVAEDKSEVELVMKGRPAILDGSYEVTRLTCEQLER